MAEALLVETEIEYETPIRFVNVLRTRDATFTEMASRVIEVSQSKLRESGLHDNALPLTFFGAGPIFSQWGH